MLEKFSRRGILRTGYGAVIAVLVASAGEAYRIQASLSRQHLGIYRHYVDEEAALTALRRNLWSATSDVRDFFISTTPAQAQILGSRLETLRHANQRALNLLDHDHAWPAGDFAPNLRKGLAELWALIDPLPRTMLHEGKDKQFDFLQREIVPRRERLSAALLELTSGDQQRLQQSEREFADTRRRAAAWLMLMLSFSVILCFAVACLSIRHTDNLERRAQANYAEVERARRELQQLSARLLEIEEEGRRRLSRELHDEIGQTLALLQIEISHAQAVLAVQPAAARERLGRAREMAERAVQTVRHISVLLRPALLDDLGLVPALHFQLEEFMRRSGIQCEFVEQGVADQLPDAVKTAVYRVVQEALHNCEKHSGATTVRVAVRRLSDSLVAEIEDNGRGFALNEQRMPSLAAGLGLLGIRERAAAAGGSLVIDSAPGHGTRIAFHIPVAPPQPSPAPSPCEVPA